MDGRQLEIIDQLYKSILIPDKWSDILDLISEDLGAFGVNIFVGDSVLVELQNGWSSTGLNPITRDYHDQNFFQDEVHLIETYHTLTNANILRDDVLEREHNKLSKNPVNFTRFHQWMSDKYQIAHRFLGELNNHPSQFDSLSILYRETPQEALQKYNQRAQLYRPHLANLINVSRPFLLLKARFNAVLEVLDRFKLGVFLLDFNGQLIEKNTKAQQMLDQNDGLALSSRKKIVAANTEANQTLQQEIASLQQPNSHTKVAHPRLAIKRPSAKTDLLLEASLLKHFELPIGVMLIVIDPTDTALIDTSNFSTLFYLTPAEQEICQLLVEGFTSREIAEQRNSRFETVRAQIKSILLKTDTRKQSDLVRLALTINIPVA